MQREYLQRSLGNLLQTLGRDVVWNGEVQRALVEDQGIGQMYRNEDRPACNVRVRTYTFAADALDEPKQRAVVHIDGRDWIVGPVQFLSLDTRMQVQVWREES